MTVSADRFREVMASLATGVTVVTGSDSDGGPVGFTANAVCSVSLDPPLLLVCADRGSQSLTTLLDTGCYAVSVLSAEDEAIARRFSDGTHEDRFRGVELQSGEGELPILSGSLAWVRCRVWRSFEAGDHTIMIGEVGECGTTEGGAPLIFFKAGFRTIADLTEPPDG